MSRSAVQFQGLVLFSLGFVSGFRVSAQQGAGVFCVWFGFGFALGWDFFGGGGGLIFC